MNLVVECGAVPALVKHLQAPPPERGGDSPIPYTHEVEKDSAFALGLIAVKVIQHSVYALWLCLLYHFEVHLRVEETKVFYLFLYQFALRAINIFGSWKSCEGFNQLGH